ncbi:phage tail protein [Methylogaea oryzae]|nr:tail fiber protein [Methylogaea oryzae]
MFGFDFAPAHWALCQGQTMGIQQNTALYALLGTQFGGNGQTTFGLPDLRGRVPLAMGVSPVSGNVYQQGVSYVGGTEAVTLAINQIPSHSHAVKALSAQGSVAQPADAIVSSVKPAGSPAVAPPLYGAFSGTPAVQALNSGTVSGQGGGAHPNMQPFAVLNFCIALNGIFPARN